MLLGITGVEYLGAFDLLYYRFCGIHKVYATAVLTGLYELTRMLVGYDIYVGGLLRM